MSALIRGGSHHEVRFLGNTRTTSWRWDSLRDQTHAFYGLRLVLCA